MIIIFDLKLEENWADEINQELKATFPSYIHKFGDVGSEKWWNHIEDGDIASDTFHGEILEVGLQPNSDGEIEDLVLIQPTDDSSPSGLPMGMYDAPAHEYIREGYWLRDEVIKGKSVEIYSVQICPSGELDSNTFHIETKVKVW